MSENIGLQLTPEILFQSIISKIFKYDLHPVRRFYEKSLEVNLKQNAIYDIFRFMCKNIIQRLTPKLSFPLIIFKEKGSPSLPYAIYKSAS